MDEIALEAEKRGLIDSAQSLRRESPLAFVLDLWVDNPAVLDGLNLHRESLPEPKRVRTVADVLDVLS